MLDGIIQGTSNVCSTVCWIALIFTFLCLLLTGVCLVAMFYEEAAQETHPNGDAILTPLINVSR